MRKFRVILGILFIIGALIVGGYYVYENFFSDISANQEKVEIIDKFRKDTDFVEPPTVSETEFSMINSEGGEGSSGVDDSVEGSEKSSSKNSKYKKYKNKYSTIAPKQFGDPPSIDRVFKNKQVMGILHVPIWNNQELPIREGSSRPSLRGSAGHYENTALMGEVGNFAISAHRRSQGSNFRHIDHLRPGHKVIVETKDIYYVYKVYDNEIVKPSNNTVLYPVPKNPEAEPAKRLMTMTTCHPEWGESERFVVYSELEYWVWKTDGVPEDL